MNFSSLIKVFCTYTDIYLSISIFTVKCNSKVYLWEKYKEIFYLVLLCPGPLSFIKIYLTKRGILRTRCKRGMLGTPIRERDTGNMPSESGILGTCCKEGMLATPIREREHPQGTRCQEHLSERGVLGGNSLRVSCSPSEHQGWYCLSMECLFRSLCLPREDPESFIALNATDSKYY